MTEIAQGVVSHYTAPTGLADLILNAAAEAGITEITPETLAPVDEFHTGGLAATRQLVEFAGFNAGDSVLDLGCGIGGPARVLAGEYGCNVTGIDLTPEFVEAARTLTEKCGLSATCRFENGDATALPFETGTFDGAWTEHVVMNIRERQAFYNEAFRVLKPGAPFAFFDLLLGDQRQPFDFPVPWAQTPDISFLHTTAETREFLVNAGFKEEKWEQLRLDQAPPPPMRAGFGLQLVIGADLPARIANVMKAIMEGKIIIVRGLFRKPA